MEGFLLIDKPAGPTSHDIVNMVRRLTGEKRVGHAGTLDPFATGLLLIGVGRTATREFSKLVGKDKTYVGTLVFGAVSDTQDGTGVIIPTPDAVIPTQADIEPILPRFTGPIKQTPPMYSAKKIDGKKLYDLARAGKEVEREPSDVTIHSLSIVTFDSPRCTFEVRCSSGTYIRTLANDIGQAAGCGAYLEALRRTHIGEWSVDKAVSLANLTKETVGLSILPIASIVGT